MLVVVVEVARAAHWHSTAVACRRIRIAIRALFRKRANGVNRNEVSSQFNCDSHFPPIISSYIKKRTLFQLHDWSKI
jgi:hypothetical protein